MARNGQRQPLDIWSWPSATKDFRDLYRSKRGPKPPTRREDAISKSVGLAMRKARKAARLGPYEAAELLAISQPQLSYYENGKDSPRLSLLYDMAELYRVDVQTLFNASKIPTTPDHETGV